MKSKIKYLLLFSTLFLLFGTGCAYRAPIVQGNLLDQEDVDQLEIGMTRGQVRFLLGTPMIDDVFKDDRWDYIYFIRIGRDQAILKRWVSITFNEEGVIDIATDKDLSENL